jgi:hypothetical protein
LTNKFEVTGNTINTKKGAVGKKKPIRTAEINHHTEQALNAESWEVSELSF